MTLSIPKVEEHLRIDSLKKAVKELIDLSSCSYNLVSFYSRLVNRLISEWRNGYGIEKSPPRLLSCAANLTLGPDHAFSILMNENDAALEVYCASSDKMDLIYNYVVEACNFVNTNYFQDRLQIYPNHREVKRPVYRNINTGKEKALDSSGENTESVTLPPNLEALLKFFPISKKLARVIHEEDEDMTPEELVESYYGDKETFENEILPELGIANKIHKNRIIKRLEQEPEPPKPLKATYYAILNFHDDNELAVKEEEDGIVERLKASQLTSKVFRGHSFPEIHSELTRNQEYKVAHFAMHRSSIDKFITNKIVTCLKNTSVKFAFLNTCKSKKVADHLHDDALIEWILYWESKVEDNTARTFAEAIYEYLSMNRRQNFLDFEGAFDYATKHLELRNYLLLDPNDDDDIEKLNETRKESTLVHSFKAAGIPKLLERSMQQKDNQEHEANQTMQVGTMNSSVLQESTQSAASTMIASQHPYNSQQMINAQNSFSKKRKREDGDVEQRDSDDASLKTSNESPSVPKPKLTIITPRDVNLNAITSLQNVHLKNLITLLYQTASLSSTKLHQIGRLKV